MSDLPLPIGIATGACVPASSNTAGVVEGGPSMSIKVMSLVVSHLD